MSFDWREYLQLAKKLAGQPVACVVEGEYRSGVSRAYYAAYCYARKRARDQLGFRPSHKADDHWRIRDFLEKHGQSAAAKSLLDLRDARTTCDYDDTTSTDPALLLLKAICDAQDVIEGL